MESFLKKILSGKADDDCHNYIKRYGRGEYKRRFIVKVSKGGKIKINGSFELANDFAKFVNGLKELKFTGKVFSKEKIEGMSGKKKAGVFVYEISEGSLKGFENAYFYLLNVNDSEIVLKVKKGLPKPGKDAEKIDDKFCSLEIAEKYWPSAKEIFFWDIPECKKAIIEHDLKINDIILPAGEKDPVKMRELAKRKGIIVRRMEIDGKETSKDFEMIV